MKAAAAFHSEAYSATSKWDPAAYVHFSDESRILECYSSAIMPVSPSCEPQTDIFRPVVQGKQYGSSTTAKQVSKGIDLSGKVVVVTGANTGAY